MTRVPRVALHAALLPVLLVAALAACSSDDSPGEPTDAPGVADVDVPGLPGDIDYVALGDSYSAGPFIGTMRNDPSGCARSLQNYPAFIADWLDVASYTDVSCSAATTDALSDQQLMFNGEVTGPQLDALSEGTDLVTIGIGGNDFGIYNTLVACQGPRERTCPQARLRRDAGRVAGHVREAVQEIGRRAPDAEVFVVGYPQILPAGRSCGAVDVGGRALAVLNGVARELNRSLERGAEGAGATYVDLAGPSRGHDVCAGKDAWINGPRFRAGIAAPFHPLAEGMRGAARAVYAAITGAEAPDSERAEPDPAAVVVNEAP